MTMHLTLLHALACLCLLQITELSQAFQLTVLHTNDVHARIAQFNKTGILCSDDDAKNDICFGGVARLRTKVQEIRKSHDNVLLLDAGDQFLGTVWFDHYKGLAAAHFMQQLGYDAMCLGNHEFDLGIDGLVTFLEKVPFPVLSANINVTEEPRLQGKTAASHVFTVGAEKIGIIGYISQDTVKISNGIGKVRISDVLESVKAEVAKLSSNGVNKIIALGHAGFTMDEEVAALDGVDVVIGGRSNTFLYKGPAPSNDTPDGDYPTVITKKSGAKGLVIQDFKWGKYLGYLNVNFDTEGEITAYSGNPILLDSTVKQDPQTLSDVQQWSQSISQTESEEFGKTNVLLSGSRLVCRLFECNFGNLITDAIVDYFLDFPHGNDSWAPASIAIVNSGSIRASFKKGPVTLNDILKAVPYANEVNMITIRGHNLKFQLMRSGRKRNITDPDGGFLQFSGLRVVYNKSKRAEATFASAQVRCLDCPIPRYAPLEDDKFYNVLTSKFLINGGDGYMFLPVRQERYESLLSTILAKYFKKHSPVYAELDGRITFQTKTSKYTNSAVSSKCSSCLLAILITIWSLL